MNKYTPDISKLNHHQKRYLLYRKLNKAFELMGDNYD